jgi:hypothetical protein
MGKAMKLSDIAVMIDLALAHDLPTPLDEMCASYPAKYYAFLHNIAGLCEGTAVELGVEKGRGCAAIASGNPRLRVVGLDHTPRPEEWAAVRRRFPNVELHESPSMPVPAEVTAAVKDHGPISLLHVDTEHSFAMAQEEFKAYRGLLASPAVVCFDDLHAMDDGVMGFVVTLPYPKVFDDRLHSCGYGVVLYER